MFELVKGFKNTQEYQSVLAAIQADSNNIVPAPKNIFRPFREIDLQKLKVVMVAPEPYNTRGLANGLALSVNNNKTAPPELTALLTALSDIHPDHNPAIKDLTGWQDQGVLLANAVLTGVCGSLRAHRNIGWEKFLDMWIEYLEQNFQFLVWVFLGLNPSEHLNRKTQRSHGVIHIPQPHNTAQYRCIDVSQQKTDNIFLKINSLLEKYHPDQTGIEWQKVSVNAIKQDRFEDILPIWTDEDEKHDRIKL